MAFWTCSHFVFSVCSTLECVCLLVACCCVCYFVMCGLSCVVYYDVPEFVTVVSSLCIASDIVSFHFIDVFCVILLIIALYCLVVLF